MPGFDACRDVLPFGGTGGGAAGFEQSLLKSGIELRSWRCGNAVAVICIALITIPYLALVYAPSSLFPREFGSAFGLGNRTSFTDQHPPRFSSFAETLQKAAMPNKTVIITTVNGAWAESNQSNTSMIDLFLRSFDVGEGTRSLLGHLLIVALDERAFNRCLDIHPHCYKLKTGRVDFSGEKGFMTADYLKMMWTRIRFLRTVLEKGYSFVFTDADVLWFRNPFPHFLPGRDVQIACDQFNGTPTDLHNLPNGGFLFVRANNRTVKFYDYWYKSRLLYPEHHDQDVLNDIKFQQSFLAIGLHIRFLDTQFFGGFCAIQRSNLEKVTTMHANCCKGLHAKIADLKAILVDWIQYRSNNTEMYNLNFRAPQECPNSWIKTRNVSN